MGEWGAALVLAAWGAIGLASGCSGDTEGGNAAGGGAPGACTPGETRVCTGPNGCQGGQICHPIGAWPACDCGGGMGGGGAGGSGGGGGAGGSGGGAGSSGGAGGSSGDAASDAPGDSGVVFSEPCGNPASVTGQGLQYSGSVSLVHPKPGSPSQQQRLSVSAPIHPSIFKLYPGEGPNYPTTLSGQQQLAKDSSLTFCFLLGTCPANFPQIKTTEPLSPAQLATNYSAIADCAYTQYGGKPYWIPQLIQDVEICTLVYGAGWHVPTEQMLNEITEADYTVIQNKLATLGNGNTYFNLHVWARDKSGAIAAGDMTPGVSPRVKPLTVSGSQLKIHYESDLGLRCVRLQDL